MREFKVIPEALDEDLSREGFAVTDSESFAPKTSE
eukprot:CAMPEP_0114979128 /NCGR_PEP_ID=MMETSP0216-20121206/4194_1 /TAXON_ID=223996 /ORGANISM="Protocruzia adherens, Strain Boccale" /LENGTH=34 /DNA_ID= /DNA_START= /DNA_END= /DNA_ORIENTATION=